MKNSKKIQLEFRKRVNEIFENLGFIPVSDGERYELKINTKLGFFYVSTHEDNATMFAVYGNFLQFPNKAEEKFNHWKQNIYSLDPIEIALDEIENFYFNVLKTANA